MGRNSGNCKNLLPQTADSDSPSTTAAPLPEITLGQAQLSVLLPDDEITLSAYGTLTPFENGSAATFNFETASGPILANGEMRAQLVGTTIAALTLETNLSNDTDAFEFNLQATSESPIWPTRNCNLTSRVRGKLLLSPGMSPNMHRWMTRNYRRAARSNLTRKDISLFQ